MGEGNSPKFGPCKSITPCIVRYSVFCHSRSLEGLDNIAADGATGFQTWERIVDDLKAKRGDREWCMRAQRRLQEGKRYLKTDYRVQCTEESSPCKDHCRKFALSDPVEKKVLERIVIMGII